MFDSDILNLSLLIVLLYILMFALMLSQRYLKNYNRNKTLKFTQEEVKAKKIELATLKQEMTKDQSLQYQEMSPSDFRDNRQVQCLYEIFSSYNELAVGINEGLYDELYVKMVMGTEMMMFYKRYISHLYASLDNDLIFLPLELLLKKWDSNEGPSYKVKNRRVK